jgi:preprotein translocase subunit Sss1
MLDVMRKPENPFFKALTIAGVGVGILGIIQVIDTFLKWF